MLLEKKYLSWEYGSLKNGQWGEKVKNALHDQGVKLKTKDIPIQGTCFVAYLAMRFNHAAFKEK